MELEAQGATDVGQRREINEDYFYVDNTRGLFIVCDGVGGNAAGEVASHLAIEFTIQYIDENWAEVESAGNNPTGYFKLTQLAERAIHQTCKRIKALAEDNPDLHGMATTLTLLLIVDGKAIVGHVGDSRLYLRRDEEVFLLTTDHTLFNEMVTSFEIADLDSIKKFSHCLTRSVGSNAKVAVETLMFEARQNDVLLLCTDGLSKYFNDNSAVVDMLSGRNVNVIADSLVQFANDSGGSDNITALVIRMVDVDDFKLNAHRVRLDFEDDEPDNIEVTLPVS